MTNITTITKKKLLELKAFTKKINNSWNNLKLKNVTFKMKSTT